MAGGRRCCSCSIRAYFNYPGEAKGIYCKTHAKPGMVDVKNKLCQYPDCRVRATFANPGEIKPRFCRKHSPSNATKPNDRVCEYDGCNLRPSYNFEGETIPRFCYSHRTHQSMVNIIKKRCSQCNRIPKYNYPGKTEGIFCSHHATTGMCNVVDRTCEYPGCYIYPVFNFPGEKKGLRCNKHKLNGMVNYRIKLCSFVGCKAKPKYGFVGKSKLWCRDHAPQWSVYNPNTKCKEGGCGSIAMYGITNPVHCEYHSTSKEVDLYSRQCKSCSFELILDENGLCSFCDPKANLKYSHTKELRVKEFLDSKELKYIQYDKVIENGECGKERPDFLFDFNTHYLVVEVDENQHSGISDECEKIRMFNITQSLGLKTIFIRYNPDKYKKPSQLKRMDNETSNFRLNKLYEFILLCTREPKDTLTVVHLFYDGYDESIIKSKI